MAEQVFKKDVEGFYGAAYRDDFVAEDEIVVTITLHEYRQLVFANAQHREAIRVKDDELDAMRKERDEAKRALDALLNAGAIEGGEE